MKKVLSLLTAVVFSLGVLSGCGAKSSAAGSDNAKPKLQVVKLGVTGDDHRVWDDIKKRLLKDNIDLQIVSFADYVRPNLALSEGDIDINAFQHYAYLNKFKADHNLQIAAIGETVIAPLGVYSSSIKSINDLKNGAKIAIPNDATNEGRGLNLLQSAGVIKLKDGAGLLPTLKDITSNPKNIKFVELVATQIPRSLKDVDAAIINSGVAVDAKLLPTKDAIYLENIKTDASKPYINVIAAREKDKDNPLYKKVVKAYQTEETKKLLDEVYKGSQIPAF